MFRRFKAIVSKLFERQTPLFWGIVIVFTLVLHEDGLAQTRDKIRLGALAELTGPGAKNGESCQLGYKIAFNLFKKQFPARAEQVEIIFGDHRREAKAAISEFQRMEKFGVWGIAANHSIIGVAINPLSKSAGIPLFGVMGHESFIRDNPFAFRIIPTAQQEGGGLAAKAFERGARKAAILILEDDYILAVGDAFQRKFTELSGDIVYKDSVLESETDFASIALRIRAAQPDIIMMTLGFQQFGPAIRRLREHGVSQPIYANYWLSYPDIIRASGPKNLEGSIFITERSEYPAFLDEYNNLAEGQFRSGVVFRCYTALAVPLAVLGDHSEIAAHDEFVLALQKANELSLPDRKVEIKGREVQFESEFYMLRNGQPRLLVLRTG